MGKAKAHSVLTAWDHKQHGRKRRVITQAFSETALRRYEPAILAHVNKFCERLLEGCDDPASQGWSVSKNLAYWSNYLSFDIMADVVFSGQLDLMSREDKRYMIPIIDDLQYRIGVLSQIPWVYDWGIARSLMRKGYQSALRFREATAGIVTSRVKSQEKHQDAYQSLIDAKDPETGKGLGMDEMIAEASVLIIAGTYPCA